MNRTAMILAAGLGTRLKELTANRPKALVEVAGKTLLERNIENLVQHGFDTIIINIHHFGEKIIRFLRNAECGMRNAELEMGNSAFRIPHSAFNIYLSDERGMLMDTGGGIVQALPFFHNTEAVLVHNVDILSDVDLRTYYEGFLNCNDDAWLLTQDRTTSRKLLFDNSDLLVGWRNLNDGSFKWVDGEKNNYKEMAFNGIHIFKPSIFAEFPWQRYSIIDLYLHLANQHRIRSKEIHPTFWFDIGKKDDFQSINTYFTHNL